MPRPRVITSSTQRFIDSPIAQITNTALAKIDELKLKYHLNPKGKKSNSDIETLDSPELIYSHKIMDVVKDFLEKLNNLLQQFDNNKKTSVGISLLKEMDAMKSLQLKLITKKASLFEDIKKELPNLIKQAKKELLKEEKKITATIPSLGLKECIRDQLNKCKMNFSKQAIGIPGKDLDLLFNEIVDIILERDYSGIGDADLGCDLVKIIVNDDQHTPTFESISDKFKGKYGVILYGETFFYADRINNRVDEIVVPLGEESSFISLNELMSKMPLGVCRSATSKELKQITILTGSTRDLTDVLKRVDEQLFNTDEHYSFTIAHQMTYEFALFMVELMDQRPSKLEELLPFFNPQVLNVDLNSGAIGWAVSKALAGYSYVTQLDNSSAKTNYQVKISTYYNGYDGKDRIVKQETINGAESYKEYFTNFFSLLTAQLPQYLRDYADSYAVKSEQARVKLLQKFIVNENERLALMISAQQDEPNTAKKEGIEQIKNEIAQLDTLDALQQENAQLEERVKAINALQQQLTEFAVSYETTPARDLIEKHEDLKAQFALDTDNHLDVAYANEPLPDNVLVVNVAQQLNDVALRPIKKYLVENLAFFQELLRNRLDSIAVRQAFTTHAMQQLNSSKRAISVDSLVDLSVDNDDPRVDTERAIAKLRQEAREIYSQYSASVEEDPAEYSAYLDCLSSHHQSMIIKHSEMVDDAQVAITNFVAKQLCGYTEIYELLVQSKKSEIPFDEIDKLPFLASHPSTKHTGFYLLLVLIGAESEIVDWEAYRQQPGYLSQLITFKKQPNLDDFSIRLSKLTETIYSKIQYLKEPLKNESESNQTILLLKQHIKRLSEVIREVDYNYKTLRQLTEHYEEECKNKCKEDGRNRIQNYNLELSHNLDAITFNEQYMTAVENKKNIFKMNELLEQRESMEKLAEFVGCAYPTHFFEQKIAEIAAKKKANDQLSQRFQNRTFAWMILDSSLEDELKLFSSIKKRVKKEFIAKLRQLLTEYDQSGDSKPAIAFIKANLKQFAGQGFQAFLYKSLSALMDLDCQIPVDYLHPEEVKISHEAACKILQESPKKYSAKVNKLYNKITNISKYGDKLAKGNEDEGEIVQKLSKELKQLVDNFVVTNKNVTPAQKRGNFLRFKDHFTARAHSEDDVMRRHYNVWTPIVANLVIGVLTVGIALGIKLIYSLVAERRASPLFFDRSRGEVEIACMENTVVDLAADARITNSRH